MGTSRFQVLSQAQVQQFLSQGYTVVEGCFTEDFARPLREQACRRLGCDLEDPATWKQEIAYLDHHTRFRVKDLSPRAWAAICEVVKPAIATVEIFTRSVVSIAAICAVDKPAICTDVIAAICVVVRDCTCPAPSLDNCAGLRAANWAVVSAAA